MAAAKAAKVDYFIRTMPHGYDTVLDNEAGNLSAGQRQLLTIARVFLCNPPILILDEATSSVDTRTEVEIGKAMKQLMQGRTSFVIAHRLSTIRDADTILFMEQGNIIEQGTTRPCWPSGGPMPPFITASLSNHILRRGNQPQNMPDAPDRIRAGTSGTEGEDRMKHWAMWEKFRFTGCPGREAVRCIILKGGPPTPQARTISTAYSP